MTEKVEAGVPALSEVSESFLRTGAGPGKHCQDFVQLTCPGWLFCAERQRWFSSGALGRCGSMAVISSRALINAARTVL